MTKEILKNKAKTGQKGITLIALIITIIVLLILAGVTISTIVNNNSSSMEKAKEAREETEKAEAKERVVLMLTEWKMKYMENREPTLDNYLTTKSGTNWSKIQSYNIEDIEKESITEYYATVNIGNESYCVTIDATEPENPKVNEVGKAGARINGVPKNITINSGSTYNIQASLSGITGTINWSSSKPAIVSVDGGKLTASEDIDSETQVTITASANGVESKTCTVTVTCQPPTITTGNTHDITSANNYLKKPTFTWAKLSRLANVISNNEGNGTNQINNDTMEVTITDATGTYILGVGDKTTVTYNETETKEVRILGFNHDTIAGDTKKAGISFEFVTTLVDSKLNNANTNTGGWKDCDLRMGTNNVNSLDTYYLPKLDISTYIKSVTKKYIPEHSVATTSTVSDKLWLLACSEIWDNPSETGAAYGYAITDEGAQYKYYKEIKPDATKSEPELIKKDSNNNPRYWWLRSPNHGVSAWSYCNISTGRRLFRRKLYNS